jgi:outer membrane protein assembly factor BamB
MRKGASSIIRGVFGRAVVVAAVAGTIVAIAAAGQALASPADQATAYQNDVAHDGYIANAGLSAPLTHAWSYTLPGDASFSLIVNGVVYVTAANTLYALNQATGAQLWSRAVGGTYASPGLTYDRGRVFTVNSDGLLTAVNATTGSVAWSKQLPGQYLFTAAPTASNGIVYTGGAGSGGTVYATRESNGQLLWTQPVENGDDSSPAVDAQGVYVTYACQQDYAFDPLTGGLLWHHSGACEGGGGATPVVANGLVFSPGYAAGNLILSASDGSELGPYNAGPPPAVANDTAFMLSGSTLSAVTDGGQGVNAWQFTGDSHLHTAPLVVGSLVFVASSGVGNLYALDTTTGTTSWSTTIGLAPDGSPPRGLDAANGTLIVSNGNVLMAYRTAGTITDPPANDSLPTIDGTANVGQLVAADVGIWSGLPSGYTYQWELCDGTGANCADINGATDFTYTPTPDDAGSTLRVKVVATNDNGSSGPVESAASGAVGGSSSGPPVNKTLPTIDGTAQQDGFLTADPGTWSGNPTSFSYQWRSCTSTNPSSCSDIAGETDQFYFPTSADVGDRLVVRVIATNADGDSAPADSAQTDPVLPPPPENLSSPTISGSAVVGMQLSADPGQWDGNPTSFTYQWFSCDISFNDCPNIVGATDQTYVVQPADTGRLIGVEVVATNQNGPSFPADSDVIGPVTGPPANLTLPAITGTARTGDTLTVSQGTWSANPTNFTFQWYSCDDALVSCNAIPAAFGSSYQIGSGDVGRRLVAGVVASNSSGDSAEKRSNATDLVLPAAPSLQASPTISGTAEVGRTLTAHPGSWTNSPTSYQYHWERCDSSGSGCTSITGAVGASHKLASDDLGERLVVEVVAVNAGGQSGPADSSDSPVVKAAPKCHVPNVVGLKLAAAKTKIRAHQCSVGHITRKTSGPAKKGRVVSQSPKWGRTLADRGKVNLGVGKG